MLLKVLLGFTVEACTSRTLPDSKSAILLPPSHKSKDTKEEEEQFCYHFLGKRQENNAVRLYVHVLRFLSLL